MAGFSTHTGTLAVVPGDNIDTDRIIPARFLSRIERAGYGELLFKDVRGPEFALDQPEAEGATIMVVGTNFGCGSSREHAVWAIQQAGYRCVIARVESNSPGFSDIFRQNSENCGLLLLELPPKSTGSSPRRALGRPQPSTCRTRPSWARAVPSTSRSIPPRRRR